MVYVKMVNTEILPKSLNFEEAQLRIWPRKTSTKTDTY